MTFKIKLLKEKSLDFNILYYCCFEAFLVFLQESNYSINKIRLF